MTLTAGTRLGPYEILSPLGAGGMGEVYRAKDTRLERTVAVKVLPSHLSSAQEVRQRFEREAKTISQLSHPHICALYDVGHEGDVEYLVMELLEGETLSDRLARSGALPLEQTLRFGPEIADALDRAHRQGIVHRDLKPSNVMLTRSGVKLLDFGLAKAMAPAAPESRLTAVPTQQGLTQEGTILGTFQYMAPEQLEGKEADGRTDIFAFGTLLYEMATGKKAFSGGSQASLISAIMQNDPPPISSVQPASPPALDRIVRTCLAKDPEERWQSASDLKRELRWISEGPSESAATPAVRLRTSSRVPWAIAALAILAAIGIFLSSSRRERPRVVQSSLLAPEKSQFNGDMELSPDGDRLAFVAAGPGGFDILWVRSLRGLSAQPLLGTEGAVGPFWSPDGKSLGFFADGKLRRIEASGGSPQALADAPSGRGGTWSREDVILFAPSVADLIYRVSSSGGEVSLVTARSTTMERGHRWPRFLPDGKHFVYVALGGTATGTETDALFVASLDSKERQPLVSTRSSAAWVTPGYLLYFREGTLFARRFDAKRLRWTGEAVAISQGVRALGTRKACFSVSRDALVYQTGTQGIQARLSWLDRSGKELERVGVPPNYHAPRLSRDGRRVALVAEDLSSGTDLWVFDFARKTSSRFTFDPANEFSAVWAPDDRRLLFASSRKGLGDLYWKETSGTGKEELVLASPTFKIANDWSPDGRFLVYHEITPTSAEDLWVYSIADRKTSPYLKTSFGEKQAQISPDGRFLAFVSNESGTDEVYVRAFPVPDAQWQISTAGGTQPTWSRNGRELFFVAPPNRFFSVEVRATGGTFEAGIPRLLFETQLAAGPGRRLYDVSSDGQRFLVSRALGDEAQAAITLVENWAAELKR